MSSAPANTAPHTAFSATNPCHVYDLAVAMAHSGARVSYYSGYPRWRLRPPAALGFHAFPLRTVATYGLLRLPRALRPSDDPLFRWQDEGFDRSVARALRPCDFLHGLPGQCAFTFERARQLGIRTVLNHASGPVNQQMKLIEPEYRRAGYPFNPDSDRNRALKARIRYEIQLADYHCVASSIVRRQLIDEGIAPERIAVVPYGADPQRFPKQLALPETDRFRIIFAGQLSLRKGLYYLLRALEHSEAPDWDLNCYGPTSPETEIDFRSYSGRPRVHRHGPVSQSHLGTLFGKHAVLVLPSAEEAFGLVVVQALQSGLPCIVSDRVGAADLIRHRINGSVVPFGDPTALLEELRWWRANPSRVAETHDWSEPAACMQRWAAQTLHAGSEPASSPTNA